MRKAFWRFSILLVVLYCASVATAASPSLKWNEKEKTFSAKLPRTELRELLQKISEATGWDVYVEPGTVYFTSTQFEKLPQTEALRLLFGELNFKISPQSNSIPQLFVFSTGAEKATQLIRAEKTKLILGKNKLIENHLIVSLKPGSGVDIETLAQRWGAKVIGKIDGVEAYLLEFPDAESATAARRELSKTDSVAAVDSNYLVDRPSPVAMASADRGAAFNLKAASENDGKQVIIGLIDTAVQPLAKEMEAFLLPRISTGNDASDSTLPSHGTTMAETILKGLSITGSAGEPSSVKILPVNVFGNNLQSDTFSVGNGVVQAVNGGADILSLPLGSEGDSAFLKRLSAEVTARGIPIFAAAGNQPVTTPTYPAAYSEVVAVTSAMDRNGTIAPYANRGSFVDVILPGSTVISFNGKSYFVNGTSVSTALASGMMAGIAEASGRPVMEVVPGFTSATAFKPE